MGWINRFYQARHEKKVAAAMQFLSENKGTMASVASNVIKNKVLLPEGVEMSIDGYRFWVKESELALSFRGVTYHFRGGKPFVRRRYSASEQLFTKNQAYIDVCDLVNWDGENLYIGNHIVHRNIGHGDAQDAAENLKRNFRGEVGSEY